VGYQTAAWDKPAKFTLREISQSNDVVTVEADVFDKEGVSCLDATNTVRFGLAGDGRLLDNLGTSIGSRVVQMYNGRAQISLRLASGKAVVGVVSIVATIPFMLNGTSPIDAFFYLATYGADLIIVAYLLTSIAALVWSIRWNQRNPGRIVALVLAIVVMGYIIKGTVIPIPESPFDLCMYAAAATIVIGLACLLLPRLRRNLTRSPLFTAAAPS